MKNYYELDSGELMEIDGGKLTWTGSLTVTGTTANGTSYTGTTGFSYTPDSPSTPSTPSC